MMRSQTSVDLHHHDEEWLSAHSIIYD